MTPQGDELTTEPPQPPPPLGELRQPPGPPVDEKGPAQAHVGKRGIPTQGVPSGRPRRRRASSIIVPGVLGIIALAAVYDVARGKAW